MNLYIETENGVVKNHPAFEENLIQAFGEIPERWESFIRVQRPTLGVYEVLESEDSTYEKVNGTWTDVWHIRNMTEQEKTAKQQEVIASFNNREYASNWSAWTLNEDTCTMQPPIPRPTEGIDIRWCGADNNWKEVPTRQEGQVKFDFIAWKWVAL